MRRSARKQSDDAHTWSASISNGRIPLVSLLHTLAVAEHLNFRHAAAALGVSQSSVSTRIKTLEQDLGVLLFERRARGVKLTEAGRIFVDEISVGIGHLNHAIRTVGAISSGDAGQLLLGLSVPVACGFIAELCCHFRQRYPKVTLVVSEGKSSETIRKLLDGSLDMAVVIGEPKAPQCHTRLLWSEPLVIALTASHPCAGKKTIHWTDVMTDRFLVRHAGSGTQVFDHLVRRLGTQGRSPEIRCCDVERDTLMQMIGNGLGITLTCASLGRIPYSNIRFLPIADEPETAHFSALWSPHNRNPALKNLLALAEELGKSSLPSRTL